MPGTAKPVQNQYSWTNLSSLLYVEQPVGTGYSLGTPNAQVIYPSFEIRLMTIKMDSPERSGCGFTAGWFLAAIPRHLLRAEGKELLSFRRKRKYLITSRLLVLIQANSMRECMCLVRSALSTWKRTIKSLLDIADYIYSNPTLLDLNLKGIWIADRELH
jgi:hypothetical protein